VLLEKQHSVAGCLETLSFIGYVLCDQPELILLTVEEQRELLVIARSAIHDAVSNKKGTPQSAASSSLQRSGGVFVTLFVEDQLRGCVGYVDSPLPLAQAVAELAPKAAFEDIRFPPLRKEEMPGLVIELSILTPPREIASIEEIEVGYHGLILELGKRRGLLLPRVATDHGWDRQAFLQGVAQKAGLSSKAWTLPGARLKVFSAQVIEEAVVNQKSVP